MNFLISRYITKIAEFTIILFCLVWSLLYSMALAINVPTFHLDGAFQTASSLFRLNSGQFPGKDFFPYLGVGPISILFPIFKALGATLSASVTSAQFVTLVAGILSISLILHLIWRPKSFSTSIAAGAILFIAPITVATYFSFQLPDWIVFSISPGNSLRPIRAWAPYLLAISYYFFILEIEHEKVKYILSGILTALILLWSNDYAIPSAGLFVLFVSIHSLCTRTLNVRNFLAYFFSVFISLIVLLNLVTHGNPLSLIKYNFFDVAKDQWWFFGPYGESSRIFSIQQFGKLLSQENQFPLVILASTAILAIKTRLIEHILIFWIGLVLLAGGAVASVGGHLGGYFGAFYFWGVVTIIIIISHFILLVINKLLQQRVEERVFLRILVFVLLTVLSSLVTLNAWNNLQVSLLNAKNDPNRFYVPELGGYLGRQWSDYISLIRKTDSNQVIEEYWGIWSATRKIISAWPVDSVISALGSKRETAAHKLQAAKIIVSTRYTTAPEWQPWNLSQNYWFYGELIKNWTPYELSPTTVVWQKNSNISYNKRIDSSINNKSKQLVINAPGTGFYEVEMKYLFSGDGRFILMAKNNLSIGADSHGYVSLNPEGRIAKFPIYIFKKGLNSLDIKVIGVSKYNLELVSCDTYQISLENSNVLRVPGAVSEDFFSNGR